MRSIQRIQVIVSRRLVDAPVGAGAALAEETRKLSGGPLVEDLAVPSLVKSQLVSAIHRAAHVGRLDAVKQADAAVAVLLPWFVDQLNNPETIGAYPALGSVSRSA